MVQTGQTARRSVRSPHKSSFQLGILSRTAYAEKKYHLCGERVSNMCGNNSGLWIIIVLILLLCCGGGSFGYGCGCGGCGENNCGCGGNCGCGSCC